MTCPAYLHAVAEVWGFEKRYPLGTCVKPANHRGPHEIGTGSFPVKFDGTPGKWVAKVTVGK